MTYIQPTHDQLIISGRFEGHTVEAYVRRVNLNSFMIVSRGFRWMRETPFNR